MRWRRIWAWIMAASPLEQWKHRHRAANPVGVNRWVYGSGCERRRLWGIVAPDEVVKCGGNL